MGCGAEWSRYAASGEKAFGAGANGWLGDGEFINVMYRRTRGSRRWACGCKWHCWPA